MKTKLIAVAMFSTFGLTNVVSAADIDTATTTATWKATATKRASTKLRVTPLDNLKFDYLTGSSAFSEEDGLFDVEVTGNSNATNFKLTSQIVSNTLSQISTGSTLTVGVRYSGSPLQKGTPTVLVDTANHIINKLGTINFKTGTPGTGQDGFKFSIIDASADGRSQTKDFKTLPDGLWTGDVSVQFDATWSA